MSNGDASVGEALRAARNAKKLTVEQVHAETKISVEVIEALEQDDFGSFESEIYLKGFLRSYAEFLGLDPEATWMRLSRKSDGDSKEPAGGAYWDVEETVHEERLTSPRIFKRFVLPIMIVVIIVLALLLIREHRKVKTLTTGANDNKATVEVVTIAADV